MAGYNIVFRQRDFTIAAGITNVKSTLGFRVSPPGVLGLGSRVLGSGFRVEGVGCRG